MKKKEDAFRRREANYRKTQNAIRAEQTLKDKNKE